MRTRLIIGAAGIVAIAITAAWASEKEIKVSEVPAKVRDAIMAKFPGAKAEEASQEEEDGKTLYELALKTSDTTIDVTANSDGEIISIEKLIHEDRLPKPVRDALSAKYPDGQLKKVEEITEKDTTSYEVLVVTTTEVKLDPQGQVVEEEKKKSSDAD
ncbi:MAG: PepSY-like domain-containing protein [Pirellulales bacterium]